MLEERVGVDATQTQRLTAQILLLPGLVALPTAPAIGHFADKTRSRKVYLLLMLGLCTVGVSLVAGATSSRDHLFVTHKCKMQNLSTDVS